MAALQPHDRAPANLGNLQGWGSIKKAVKKAVGQVTSITKAVVAPSKSNVKKGGKAAVQIKKDLKLNKLRTRQGIKSVNHAVAAVVTGNKDEAKQAALRAGQSPAAMLVITAAGNALAPGAGAAIASAAQGMAAKAESKVMAAEIEAAMQQALTSAAAADAPAVDLPATVPTPTATDTGPPDNPWPRRILWGSVGLLTAAGLLKVAGYTNRSTT